MTGSPLPPVVATFLADISQFQAKLGEANASLAKTKTLSDTQMAQIEASVDKQVAEMATAAEAAGTEFDATATKAELMASKVEESSTASSGAFTKMASVGKVAVLGIAAGAVIVGVAAVKAATQYQTLTTQLVTGAGESTGAIKQVSDGLLKMAPAVGIGPDALATSMFTVESAGYHAADGLTVMKAAAEGAKIGGADATVVANGLTTAMTDYQIPAAQAAATTSKLVETVASGKTTMQDLSGSLSNVLPAASAAGLGLNQVLGAMATMTGEGISADQASQDLAGTIRSLQSPTQEQTKAMEALGLNSLTVANNLGKEGLTGTLGDLVTAITQHMGPAGDVIESTFKKSEAAAADAKTELAALPQSIQAVATQFMNGSITSTQWRADIKGMSVDNKQLAQQFATTVQSGQGFNDLLKGGGPSAETFSAALSGVTGGATGMNTALALTGGNLATFQNNVKNISGATSDAKGNVQGWSQTTKNLSFQVDQAKAYLQSMLIVIGQKLIPIIENVIKIGVKWTEWLTKHKTILMILVGVVGGILLTVIAAYIVSMIAAAAATIAATWPILAIIAAITLLVAAGYEIYKHWGVIWGSIKDAAGDAWDFIKRIFNDIWGFLKQWGPLILTAVAPFIGLPLLIMQHWTVIKQFFVDIWDDIKSAFSDAVGWLEDVGEDLINGLWTGVQAVWSGLEDWFYRWPKMILGYIGNAGAYLVGVGQKIITGLYDDLLNGAKVFWGWFSGLGVALDAFFVNAGSWLVNAGENIIHGLVKGITNVAGDIGKAIKSAVGNIPGASSVLGAIGLASGGVVTKPTFALLGEGGEPEYVIPQSQLGKSGLNGVKPLSSAIGPAPTPSSGGGVTYAPNIYITQPLGTPQAIQQVVMAAMTQLGSVNPQSYQSFNR